MAAGNTLPPALKLCETLTRLEDRLELAGHADLLLLLADQTLDGGGQAAGVAGEDQGIAILAGAVVLQGAAGIGDGVVVIVGVNDPVVVTWRTMRGKKSTKLSTQTNGKKMKTLQTTEGCCVLFCDDGLPPLDR